MFFRQRRIKTLIITSLKSGDSSIEKSVKCRYNTERSRGVAADEEVRTMIARAHESARNTLRENRGKMDELAEYLLEKESISGEEFMDILNK